MVNSNLCQSILSTLFLAVIAFLAPARAATAAENDSSDWRFLSRIALENSCDSTPAKKTPLLPQDEVSDLGLFSHVAIRLYQTFVSSQHHNVCLFEPSCSHFGLQAVQECGFIKGCLLAADRMQRCNHFANGYGYRLDIIAGKLFDPLEDYLPDTSGNAGATIDVCAGGSK